MSVSVGSSGTSLSDALKGYVCPFVSPFVRSVQVCLKPSILIFLAQIFNLTSCELQAFSQQSFNSYQLISHHTVGALNTSSCLIFIFLHLGKTCRYATKCQYWTYRYHQRKCYLLKSCCRHERKGFLSGTQYCPPYYDEEARSLNVEDYEEEEESLNDEDFVDEESLNDEDYNEESD